MSTIPAPVRNLSEELQKLRSAGIWLALAGACLIALGFFAPGHSLATAVTTVMVVGILLIFAAVLHVAAALAARHWGGFLPHLLVGILDLIAGIVMLERPAAGAAAFTLMLAVAFLAGGLLRIVAAIIDRFPGWPWALISGLASFALGVMIWRQWPASSEWVIGTFVGIDLIMCGMTWLMLGLTVRRATK